MARKEIYCLLLSKKLVLVSMSLILAMLTLSGCYASGHKFFDMYEYSPPTSDCQVIWVRSFDNAKRKLDRELPPVTFLGKSSFSTARTYNREAARNDCKLAGGDYIIVVEEGYVGSTQSQFTVQSTKTYTANNNTSYYGRGGYYGTSNSTTTYQVPTYQTYNITNNYYGFSYYVYKKDVVGKKRKSKRSRQNKESSEIRYEENYDEDL